MESRLRPSDGAFAQSGTIVAQAPSEARAAFITKTYLHLFGAILLFAVLEVAWFQTSLAQSMLLAGTSIKLASEKLGYASAASFSRAFAQSVGAAPRTWLQGRQP